MRIFFSKPVPLEGLQGNLRLLPLIKLDWPNSAMNQEGRLTLKGRFKFGLGYVVNLPENLKVAGLTYVPTVTSFFMPDRPPKLEFIENKSLIERDSRELLHVRAQNVQSLLLEGIRIPPLLLPQALAVAERVQRAGAQFFRGGAYKPRTSPYSFQGLGEEGLKILAEVRAET